MIVSNFIGKILPLMMMCACLCMFLCVLIVLSLCVCVRFCVVLIWVEELRAPYVQVLHYEEGICFRVDVL